MADSNKKIQRKQDRIEEIIKCGKEPSYFIKNYVKIPHPMRGLVPFETFPYQDDCLEMFQSHRLVITNKSRQLGLSTISAAYALWMSLFYKEKNIIVIATKLETAKEFIVKVKTMLDSLPPWLVLPKLTGESVRYLNFSNGSKIKAMSTSKDAGRSQAASIIIIDECLDATSKITLRNKLTGEMKEISIVDLFNEEIYE